jgi:hypothetical protein
MVIATSTKNRVVREKLTNDVINRFCSRFEVAERSSLVRIAPQTWQYESVILKEERSGGPKEIRTPDPRHVKAVS